MTDLRASDTVAVKIRQARQRRGWSMAELGSRCGLSGDVIQNIESGRRDEDGHRRRDITIDELLAIADALEISVAELIPAAALLPHRSEREMAIIKATKIIEHEKVKVAALEEVQKELQQNFYKTSSQLHDVNTQINTALTAIAVAQRTIDLNQPADD